jgi:DNA-binding MarR family transcriptional regulator
VATKTVPAELMMAATVLRLSVGRISRRVRQAHAVGELTQSELSVLSRLDREGPAAPGKLAEVERVRPQAMGSTLAALEQRGLVLRTPDPADGRRVVMSVTPAGLALLQDRRSESIQVIAAALAELSPAQRRQLIAALPLLDLLADKL